MPTTKRKSLTEEKINTFDLAFIGEFINVITDIMIVEYVQNDAQTLEQNAPMVAQGYLLDVDDMYLYLGENPLEVSQAIARSRITMVRTDRKKSKFEEMLDEMGDPNREDIN